MRKLVKKFLREESGFTLAELLVAMGTGIVIMLAAFALIDLSIVSTSRVTDRSDATATSQAAMEKLIQELNSGCVIGDVSPVQAGTASGISPAVNSDATHLVFVTGVGDGTSQTPTEHVVALQSNGALTDTSYANTGGTGATLTSASTWTFAPTPSSRLVLANHVAQQKSGSNTIPLFQYDTFTNPSNPTSGSLVGAVPVSVPLASTWPAGSGEYNAAPAIAEVDISWVVAPSVDGWNDPSRDASMNDSAVFRLTPATPGIVNNPCD